MRHIHPQYPITLFMDGDGSHTRSFYDSVLPSETVEARGYAVIPPGERSLLNALLRDRDAKELPKTPSQTQVNSNKFR